MKQCSISLKSGKHKLKQWDAVSYSSDGEILRSVESSSVSKNLGKWKLVYIAQNTYNRSQQQSGMT